jgi:hypothetical protein
MFKKFAKFFVATHLWLLALPIAVENVGSAMNQAVVVANGGKFPVMENSRDLDRQFVPDVNGLTDGTHCVMTGDTKLNFLADYIRFNGRFGPEIYSPGDILIDLGALLGGYSFFAWAVIVSVELHRKSETLRIINSTL